MRCLRRCCEEIIHICAHNFLPFDIQHTKSPKNQTTTYALDQMSKVLKLLSERGRSVWGVLGVGVSECRSVGVSDAVYDTMTLYDFNKLLRHSHRQVTELFSQPLRSPYVAPTSPLR